jgi:D-alanine-D-alanine ligase
MTIPIRVGIFLGGPSREREISFAGGRTVYDNLDKAIFKPIPIFVDSLGNFILLDWRYLYQGSIRDFYPSSDFLPQSRFQIYIESLGQLDQSKLLQLTSRIGKLISPQQFHELFDFAFFALHGLYGEDGSIQGLLEWYKIPYSGSGILGATLGMDKIQQKRLMKQAGFHMPPYQVLTKATWQETRNKAELLDEIVHSFGLPFVAKSPRQGSSIGVTIVRDQDLNLFTDAINSCLFVEQVSAQEWHTMDLQDKQSWVAKLIDLRSGIGLPVQVKEEIIYHPDALLAYLEQHFVTFPGENLELISLQGEEAVLIESFIVGREFSCIILQEAGGEPVALPPTEMLKGELHFDYRAKYLPGLVRKETPMQVSEITLNTIRQACVALYQFLGCQVYARIDGLLSTDNQLYLNDPNTTAGMTPSSFLFHQAAEIGLNPSQLLTFIIRNSLAERILSHKVQPHTTDLLHTLDQYLVKEVPSLSKLFDLEEGKIIKSA